MERRRSKRKTVHIAAEIISGSTGYNGFIENISEEGINVETDCIDHLSTSRRFSPGALFDIKFINQSGKEIMLNCRVMWSFKTAPQGLTEKIGMMILEASGEYLEFYNNQE